MSPSRYQRFGLSSVLVWFLTLCTPVPVSNSEAAAESPEEVVVRAEEFLALSSTNESRTVPAQSEGEGEGLVTSTSTMDVEQAGPGHAPANRRTYIQQHPIHDTLTNHWFGFGDQLRKVGITTTLNLWVVYQGNVSGGLDSDHDWTGTYYFDNHFDVEKLVGLKGSSIFLRVEGGWNAGITDSVGALMNVNGIQDQNEPIGLTHFWLQQNLFDDRVRFRVGKMDASIDGFDFHGTTVAFDAMPYANFGGTQFLDSGLVINSAVPFPQSGFGVMLFVEPVKRFYVAATGVDATADRFKFNFSNAFDSDAKWMYLIESGVVGRLGEESLPGQYYVGYWHSQFESTSSGQGVYLGAAQFLIREADTEQQGLGVFARYGYTDSGASGINHFWSLGTQYKGLVSGLDHDILALGWAQAFTSGATFSAPSEGALEFYYRTRITPWLHFSPHFQYIVNPGSNDIDDSITLGIRTQITF